MKVFQIGFNKCGTGSLYEFFNQNGFKSVHWGNGKWDSFFKKNQSNNKLLCNDADDIIFWSDIDFIQRQFQVFAEQYPDSKFIYNIRNIDKWIDSRKNHYIKGYIQYDMLYNQKLGLDKTGVSAENYWKSEWIHRKQIIEEYFVGEKKNRLLIYDIEKDNSQKIVDFLPELHFQNTIFPHIHKTIKIETNLYTNKTII